MTWSIAFDPFFSWPVLAALGIPAAILALVLLAARTHGALVRILAIAALILALANPVMLREERDPMKSVVSLVVDRSQSQSIGDRTAQADKVEAALKESLARFPQFEVRTVEARSSGTPSDDATTALFGALATSLQDVAPGRVAGAIMVTDGQVHDILDAAARLGFVGDR